MRYADALIRFLLLFQYKKRIKICFFWCIHDCVKTCIQVKQATCILSRLRVNDCFEGHSTCILCDGFIYRIELNSGLNFMISATLTSKMLDLTFFCPDKLWVLFSCTMLYKDSLRVPTLVSYGTFHRFNACTHMTTYLDRHPSFHNTKLFLLEKQTDLRWNS